MDSNEHFLYAIGKKFHSFVLIAQTMVAELVNKAGASGGPSFYHATCFMVLSLPRLNTFIIDRMLGLNITNRRRVQEKKDGERKD